MGNRAAVVFEHQGDISPAVYLHWNGGPESIYAFLAEHHRRKCRTSDISYAVARFCHIVGDYFDQDEAGSTSLGLFNAPKALDDENLRGIEPGDNGVYVVSPGEDFLRYKVRRFLRPRYPEPIEEMPAEWVQREREEALQHSYATAIAAVFVKTRPKISIYG